MRERKRERIIERERGSEKNKRKRKFFAIALKIVIPDWYLLPYSDRAIDN